MSKPLSARRIYTEKSGNHYTIPYYGELRNTSNLSMSHLQSLFYNSNSKKKKEQEEQEKWSRRSRTLGNTEILT